MTSPNLVPTPIVNKNGVHTTVYKAAGVPSSSSAGNLPAPALGGAVITKPTAVEIMSDLRVTFDDPWITVPSAISKSTVLRNLEGYPEETQQYIREVQLRQTEDTFFDRMLISMLYRRESPETINNALFVFDNLPDQWDALTFSSSWTDDGFDVDYDLIRKIRGAAGYGGACDFGKEDKPLREYDEKTQKQVLALIALCLDLTMDDKLSGGVRYDDVSVYLANDSTARALIEEPDRLADMLVAFQIHGRTDWDVVQAMTNAPSAPLSEGTL